MLAISKYLSGTLLLLYLAVLPPPSSAQNANGIIPAGAVPDLVSSQFSFTEGPAVDKQGNIFFTDQPNNKIWEYDTQGRLSVFLDPAGRSNGMYFDHKGNLIACADEKNQLWTINHRGKVKVLFRSYEGKKLNGPNDLWIDPRGGIYMTDPYYQRPYWKRKSPEIEGEKVYYLPPGKRKPIPVAEDLEKPNGIVGTPDGQTLYIADIKANKTWRYHILPDGRLGDKQLFVEQGSDGMTLDDHGNVYLTGNGVTVYNARGEKILHIPVPAKWTANLCFG
ncbi:MAG: SMP-30/gluconolactonase/LRE family protein, partial [Bacteroidetes bacterium]|nr:SMP-30/gluconolactonase/LRE family protein [Bacteroidota bacterium]